MIFLSLLSFFFLFYRYLPPEIGCLNTLEYLDLSFNKMRSLPTEITYLNNLISLKIANNKLNDLPSGLSSLQRLNDLDLSNNRLTSLGCLELGSMHNLQSLNLQVFFYYVLKKIIIFGSGFSFFMYIFL